MEKVILIKYGELTTKKGNRNFFVKTLMQNVLNKLKDFDILIEKDLSRMYIHYDALDEEVIINKIHQIFGIHKYHIAYVSNSDMNSITDTLIETIKLENFKTFKVETKRSDKSFPKTSMELSRIFGGIVLKNKDNIKVDVNNPDVIIHVEIREKNTYIYYNEFNGLGGYPSGIQGRGLLMLSGGIDSPVAGYLAMRRGIKVDAVYFEAIPHTSLEAREKVVTLVKKLRVYANDINLYIVPFTKIQEEIYKNVSPNYIITIMRRMMYRIMAELCKKYNAKVIINGESIGQVASQTLSSMYVINNVTNIPVIRPVVTYDKLEIIDIAKKIDTYNTSILPYEDCCTVFVPKHPIINPSLKDTCLEEEKFVYEELLKEAVNNTFIYEDTNNYENIL